MTANDDPFSVLYIAHRSERNRLLNALIDELHPHQVVFEVAVLDRSGPVAKDLAERGVRFTTLGTCSLATLPLAVTRVRRFVSRTRPRVVHSNGYLPGLSLELARASMRHPPPSLLERHHNREHYLVARRHHVWFDGWSARHASHVAAVSTAVRGTLLGEGVPLDRVDVAPNGVDWERFATNADAVKHWRTEFGAGPVATAAGRLDPMKDYPTMLRAVAIARRRVPFLRLMIAGVGNPGAREALQALANTEGIGDAVTFLGWVEDLPSLLRASDVVVQSSLDESFGQVLLEAMGLGVPLATTTPGGVIDVVGDWYRPLEPGDPDGLADELVDRLVNPDRARAHAAKAASGVRAQFDRRTMAAAHLRLYRLLAHPG